jgi:hypothetical protein
VASDQDTASPDVESVNAQASTLMKEGIRLMSDPRPTAASEALACFDRALDMRVDLPQDTGLQRFLVAACWLNRADALIRLGGGPQVAEAMRSYDEGIALARTLPMEEDPRYPRRLAIAHQNRALLLQAQQGPAAPPAVAAFVDALAVLDDDAAAAIDDREQMLATVLMNLANARAWEGTEDSCALAHADAKRALDLVAAREHDDAEAVAVGLGARHVLCRTLAQRLTQSSDPNSEAAPEDIHDATDTADDALALVRDREQRGDTRFRALAFDIFRFGARVYAIYQPHFLAEFISDNLDPGQSSQSYVESPEVQAAAEEASRLIPPANA